MAISFNQVPAGIRVPLVYIEWDNSQALTGIQSPQDKILIIGQRDSAAPVAAGELKQLTGPEQGEVFWGRGSMMDAMVRAAKRGDRYVEMWGVALDDDGAAVKAAGSIEVTAAATGAGTIAVYVAGKRVRAGVSAGDTTDAIATAINDAVAADTSLPVTATINGVNSSQVDLECRWAGETGNDIDVRVGYHGEEIPKGVTLTITALSGGTANPDVADAITAMGGEWWKTIVLPYTDASNLDAMEAELDERVGPTEMRLGIAWSAFRGTHAETTTFGDGRNSELVTIVGTGPAPTPPWEWAAVNAAVGTAALAIDPARPLQTLELPGVLPPAMADRFTDPERNLQLYDGISTYTVASDGTVMIERTISTYQENAAGVADASYLDINTLASLSLYRFSRRARVTQHYPRSKLAEDGNDFGEGQAICTPSAMRSTLLTHYQDMIEIGICEDYEGYKADLVVEIDQGDKTRMNVLDAPRLVNQLRIYAERTSFIL